ncbi:MAG: hypothetical protein ACREPT_06060, partial [Rudaea sp.]
MISTAQPSSALSPLLQTVVGGTLLVGTFLAGYDLGHSTASVAPVTPSIPSAITVKLDSSNPIMLQNL